MAKRTRKNGRRTRRLGEISLRLIVTGIAFLIVPLFISNPGLRQVMSAVSGMGWLMLLGGASLWWLGRRAQSGEAPKGGVTRWPTVPVAIPDAGGEEATGAASRAGEAPRPSLAEEPSPARRDLADAGALPVVPPRPEAWSSGVFQLIEWRRFEALVERLFQQAGFETQSQSHGADEGVDIWLYSRHQPGAPVSLVQCKHWQGKRVGVDKVRELRGVMAARQVKRGQFATTSSFTPDAVAFARESGIHLLDAEGLLDLIAQRSPEQRAELLAVALEGDYWRPTCVNCGQKMRARKPRQGGTPFWGCVQFPRCKTTMPMRAEAAAG